MAHQEHLAWLEQGVEAWNAWREDTERQFCLRRDLRGVDLHGQQIHGANFADVNFEGADFCGATITGTNQRGANLSRADLGRAVLVGIDFHSAHLDGANIRDASLEWATFANVDLSTVEKLETVAHSGPSIIGIDTVYRSNGRIPEVFLRGAGVSEDLITYITSLVGKP